MKNGGLTAGLAAAFALGAILCGAGYWALRPQTASAPQTLRAGNPLNVVVILSDALRADRVHATVDGEPLMPCLANLAETGLSFTNAVAPCSWTRPSVTSLLTGLYPETHRVLFDDDRDGTRHADALPESLDTLQHYLKRAGYATVGIQTNGNLVAAFGYARGFDTYDYLPNAPAAEVTAQALERLRALTAPYFLYVHYIDPHAPYVPPESYRARFNAMPLPEYERDTALNFIDYLMEYSEIEVGMKQAMSRPLLSEAGKEAVRALYDAECRYQDDQIRALVSSLPDPEHTCVVILADHGEGFWEHDCLGHGLTCYEEVVRVPLVIRAPGITPAVRAEPVETVSIFPTLTKLLGLPDNPQCQGSDLLVPHGNDERPVFSWTAGPWKSWNLHREMVRRGQWKLVVDRTANKKMLFDLKADPAEMRDLCADHQDRANALLAELDAHKKTVNEAAARLPGKKVLVDNETRQRQKKLGY